MATGGGGDLTDENRNYTRLSLLVLEVAAGAVRGVFDKLPIFEPKVLSKNLELNRNSPQMKCVQRFLKDILFPSKDVSILWESTEFDLTMMVDLMDKLYNPVTPVDVAAWNAKNAKIKVIRKSRNTLAHSNNASVSDQKFNEIWRVTEQAILSLADAASRLNNQKRMQDILTMPLDNQLVNSALYKMELIKAILSNVEDTQIQQGARITGIEGTQIQQGSEISELKKTQIEQSSTLGQYGSQITGLQSAVDNLTVRNAWFYGYSSKQSDEGIVKSGNISELIDSRKLQITLKEKYNKDMAHIRWNPWNPDETQPIDTHYVKLSLVQGDLDYSANQEMKMKPIEKIDDIFVDHLKKKKMKYINRILVQGCPGMGKTTFTKRLAFDWAEGRNKELSDRFDYMFVLTLGEVVKGQTLVDVITEQLLPHESSLDPNVLSYIENNKKCLFVFDGLDEMKPNTCKNIDEMIERKYLRNACLLITSRPSESQHLLTSSLIDQYAKIVGFDETNVKDFISKFFGENENEMGDSDECVGKEQVFETTSNALYKQIEQKMLSDIAKIPLILSILCILYHENKCLPDTMSNVYLRLQESLYQREKSRGTVNDVPLDDILMELGKIAFDCLLKDSNQLLIPEEHIKRYAIKAGLIWIEKQRSKSKPVAFFLHKSIQEYFASFYIAKEIDNYKNKEPWTKLKTKIDTMKELGGHELLLQFCAGASEKLAGSILDFLNKKVCKIDPKLEIVLPLMRKLSKDKKLNTAELETVCCYDIGEEVEQIVNIMASCLRNLDKPTKQSSLVVNQIVFMTKHLMEVFQKGILKPASKCFVSVSNNEELELLVKCTNSVSWLKLEGRHMSPFYFTQKTVKHLREVIKRNLHTLNRHAIGVCIGKHCKADLTQMLAVLNVLTDPRVRYTQVTLSYNKYSEEEWVAVFQLLLELKYLTALNLCSCDIPLTVISQMGQIVNQNATTLLQLDPTGNSVLVERFVDLTKEINTSLSLTVLRLWGCLHPSDKVALKEMLKLCEHVKELDMYGCKCDISHEISSLKHLKEINISYTVDSETGEGLDVAQVLGNIGKVKMLEVFKAEGCLIDDAQIKNIRFRKASKIRELDLSNNRITSIGFEHLYQNHKMLPELEKIDIDNVDEGEVIEFLSLCQKRQ